MALLRPHRSLELMQLIVPRVSKIHKLANGIKKVQRASTMVPRGASGYREQGLGVAYVFQHVHVCVA
jgi:hypothetical protein